MMAKVDFFIPVPKEILEILKISSSSEIPFFLVGGVEDSANFLEEIRALFASYLGPVRVLVKSVENTFSEKKDTYKVEVMFNQDLSTLRDEIYYTSRRYIDEIEEISPLLFHTHFSFTEKDRGVVQNPVRAEWEIQTISCRVGKKKEEIPLGFTFTDLQRRVVGKYREKIEADGETTYVYGPRQVANRHKEKAERLKKFEASVADLRKKYRQDLQAKDQKKKLTALAVALLDHTFERVGNETSAEEGHFGVTGWQVRHLKFEEGGATFRYVGKSGVNQTKKVENSSLVKVLKDVCKGKKKEDPIFEMDGFQITPKQVNEYLEDFGVTAKDLRGFHANDQMIMKLKEMRKDGVELPHSRKERDEILKKEFKRALGEVAKIVGHTTAILRSDYLVPDLEDTYMKDGSVMDGFVKKAGLLPLMNPLYNVREMIKQILLLEDHLAHPRKQCPDCINKHFLTIEAFAEEAITLGMPQEKSFSMTMIADFCRRSLTSGMPPLEIQQRLRALRKFLSPWVDSVKVATKSEYEKEDKEIESLVRKSPKKKPPRHDLRKERIDHHDPDVDQGDHGGDEDLSLNYKKVAQDFYFKKTPWIRFASFLEKTALDFHTKDAWLLYQKQHPKATPKKHKLLFQEEAPKSEEEDETKKKKKKDEEVPSKDLPKEKEEDKKKKDVEDDGDKGEKKKKKDEDEDSEEVEEDTEESGEEDDEEEDDEEETIEDLVQKRVDKEIKKLEERGIPADAKRLHKKMMDRVKKYIKRNLQIEKDPKKQKKKEQKIEDFLEEALDEEVSLLKSDKDQEEKSQEKKPQGKSERDDTEDDDEDWDPYSRKKKKPSFAKGKKIRAFTDIIGDAEESFGSLINTDNGFVTNAERDVFQKWFEGASSTEWEIFQKKYEQKTNEISLDLINNGTIVDKNPDFEEGKASDVDYLAVYLANMAAFSHEGELTEEFVSQKKSRIDKKIKSLGDSLRTVFDDDSGFSANLQKDLYLILKDWDDDQISDLNDRVHGRVEDQKDHLSKSMWDANVVKEYLSSTHESISGDVVENEKVDKAADLIAKKIIAEKFILNPMWVGGTKIKSRNLSQTELKQKSTQAYNLYSQLDPDLRRQAGERISELVKEFGEDSAEADQLSSIMDGLTLSQIMNNEEVTGRPQPSPFFSSLAKIIVRKGDVHRLFDSVENFTSGESRAYIAEVMSGLPEHELIALAGGEDGPQGVLIKALNEEDSQGNYSFNPTQRHQLRVLLEDSLIYRSTTGYALIHDALTYEKRKHLKHNKDPLSVKGQRVTPEEVQERLDEIKLNPSLEGSFDANWSADQLIQHAQKILEKGEEIVGGNLPKDSSARAMTEALIKEKDRDVLFEDVDPPLMK